MVLSKTLAARSSTARDPDTLSSDPDSVLLGSSSLDDNEEIDVVGDVNESEHRVIIRHSQPQLRGYAGSDGSCC